MGLRSRIKFHPKSLNSLKRGFKEHHHRNQRSALERRSLIHHNFSSQFLITISHHNFSSQFLITISHHNSSSQFLITISHHNSSSQFLITIPHHNSSSQFFITILHHNSSSQFFITIPTQLPMPLLAPNPHARSPSHNLGLRGKSNCEGKFEIGFEKSESRKLLCKFFF